MGKDKKEKVVIDVWFDECQNEYYRVYLYNSITQYEPPSNCINGTGIFLDEHDMKEYYDGWDIVEDWRNEEGNPDG